MDIILPVAGLGSRLRPQTWSVPKPLVALAGKRIVYGFRGDVQGKL